MVQQGHAGEEHRRVRRLGAGTSKVSLATYGIGSFAHVVAETLNRNYGLKMEAVHYRGEGADVAGRGLGRRPGRDRQLRLAAAGVLQAGSVKPIAVPTMERMKKMPDVADLLRAGPDRQGLPGARLGRLRAPAGTPTAIVQKLSALMVEARQDRARPEDQRHRSASTRARATLPTSARSSTRRARCCSR